MARFCTLFSGSSGNAAYIGMPDGGILIDAGVSCKRLSEALVGRGIAPERLWGIFITHEHIDHISGLRVFLKKYRVPLYATAGTLRYLAARDHLPPDAQVCEIGACGTELPSMKVTPFMTPHDAADSAGYRIETADGRSIAIATDLGCVTEVVMAGIAQCDLVMLEANYDPLMLRQSSYPYPLKARIASDEGHLSNEISAGTAVELVRGGTTRLVLAHLSQENNHPEVARGAVCGQLARSGCTEHRDYMLQVAPRSRPGEWVYL